MKPPICEICQKRLSINTADGAAGGLVWFKDYQDLPQGMVGHPQGLAWFCGEHYKQAQVLDDLTITDAIRKIKSSL